MTKFEWLSRIKAVERECSAVWFATDRLLDVAKNNPTILGVQLQIRQLQSASERLEGTYLIRLFAEFEIGLRRFWRTTQKKASPRKTQDLLNSVAAKQRISTDTLQGVQAVREYRNSLVHERDEAIIPLPLKDARRYLCTFFSFLPNHW